MNLTTSKNVHWSFENVKLNIFQMTIDFFLIFKRKQYKKFQ